MGITELYLYLRYLSNEIESKKFCCNISLSIVFCSILV